MKLLQKCLLWIAVSFLAAVIGGIGTAEGLGPWYDGLQKPFFTPPSWIFGPVWTVLYTLMGVSMGLMDWKTSTADVETNQLLKRIFMSQISLNALWPVIFFGAGQLWLGLAVILTLLSLIIYWLKIGRTISGQATLMIVPYALWLGYASCLNAAFAWLN